MDKKYIEPAFHEVSLETQTCILEGSVIGSFDIEGLIIEDELGSEWL